ncbi:STAS domain-containing protein [Sulfitobacter sp. JB4-11]|uniref:STAS domain-containing protein n=1 Tax=Sulfitobacter rhodophyticola TaxID=3238304 RepID=UPI0035180014
MKISTRTEGDICIVRVEEARIDASAALAFKEGVREATQDATATVILDLRDVMFIDSSGLGAIVATLKYLSPDRTLVLAGLTPPVRRVFELTRMDSVMALFETVDDALGRCRA